MRFRNPWRAAAGAQENVAVSKLTSSCETSRDANTPQVITLPASYQSSANMASIELDDCHSNFLANSQLELLELSLEDLENVAGGFAPLALYFLGSFLAGTASGVAANIIYNSFFSSPSQASPANPGSATASASCQCMAPPMPPVIQITNCTL
ncbi:MAG: hypothetical protein ACKO45_13260 [Cyanobium sp.]